MVNGERGERKEDLGEAGIFIIVSDVCYHIYLLAWDMPNVVREITSFLYVVRGACGCSATALVTPRHAPRGYEAVRSCATKPIASTRPA